MSEEAKKIEELDEEREVDEEDDDEEEYVLTAEVDRIESEATVQKRRLKKMAERIEDKHAQLVLREMAGVFEMVRELASATSEALDELDDQIGEGAPQPPIESFLLEDDARGMYAVLSTNLKLATEARDSATTSEQREALEKIVDMNEGMLKRIAEMADMNETELTEAISG
jgi:hypothetical protein